MTKVGLCLVIGALLFSVLSCSISRSPNVEAWYQREVIGQGRLVSVEAVGCGSDVQWLITLELMSVRSVPSEIVMDTYVYHVGDSLSVENDEGGYIDTRLFKIGAYYVLYRKTKGHSVLYGLIEWST